MASIPSISQFPCKSLQTGSHRHSKLSPRNAVNLVNGINFPAISVRRSAEAAKQVFTARAAGGEDEFCEPDLAGVAVLIEPPPPPAKKLTEIDVLKKQLLDSLYGTTRGLFASSETRAEILELITQLECKNPTPAPTEALTLLNGKWILVYTSHVNLFSLSTTVGALPLVKVEEISQTIDSESFTVQSSVLFSGPLSTTAISTNSKFEVRTPKRVQIKIEEGIIGTPQLIYSVVLPENVELFGQNIDLTPFKELFTSVQETASSVATTISSQPPLKFSISHKDAESWLLTTYLDEELRISREDGGGIFVLIKEGSPLLTP
ncbi:hypothetical protein ABFS82_13G129100 [Erythranthe guttata]|uniref:Plastid lipid-associated protein/fibrillin conserved domain-containing protein n=1 Tax=Erythranthe guttata TaxID=4155 RepID=A0A022QIE9_ERYGU|nr:PREDICTED: light-induced protein, chloroplastic-like [Erythranthe guttata]EYU27736.1 hypothetical protein MIMGU_mgv1a010083mg [Erythranthe guttata]|eukprot:XP_012848910.1 PREDICTED: light-induced protein, chloroplastic-like [Erythranthe guttata]